MPELHFFERAVRDRAARFLTSRVRTRRPLVEALTAIVERTAEAYLFGGLIRDLVITTGIVKPRDVDVVFSGADVDELISAIEGSVIRRTRFGGVSVNVCGWRLDLWPLEETWAFRSRLVPTISFGTLPCTTFLNIEAVTLQIKSSPGCPRSIFECGFFDAVRSRTLELNLEENPFPALAVARALVLASRMRYALGPRLVRYIAEYATTVSIEDVLRAQIQHYGFVRRDRSDLERWLVAIRRHYETAAATAFELPVSNSVQLTLWDTQNWDLLRYS